MAQSEPRSDRVTLKDVAERAGVSLATASKVMNGRADVRQSTRETVAQAARDLGYEPKRRETDGRRSALIHFDTLTSRSEEHTSELQSRGHLVCRLLLEKKNRPPPPVHGYGGSRGSSNCPDAWPSLR